MPNIFSKIRLSLLFSGALLAFSACGQSQAFGGADSIIVAVPDSAWASYQDVIESALKPRSFTVRDELIFKVTQTNPTAAEWGDLRRFENVLVIGQADDPWVARALEESSEDIPAAPALLEVENVWAQNQEVKIVLLPAGAAPEVAAPLLEEAGATYLREFQQYAYQRMFASGKDEALADTLAREAGFSLLLPEVYYWEEVDSGTYIFRNDFPDPATLIRSITVTSRPSDEVEMTANTALQWRMDLAGKYTEPPQVTDTTLAEVTRNGSGAADMIGIQGVWSNPPGDWPAAGPFLTRLVECPSEGRTYLLDAWLYAPGVPKYEYMLQLEYILNSFECSPAPVAA